MKACYPSSFQGKGGVKSYFTSTEISQNIGKGFAEIRKWEFKQGIHPVIQTWYGKHFEEHTWAPTFLLVYILESSMFSRLQIRKVIVVFKTQKEGSILADRDQGCSVIGKFTQGRRIEGDLNASDRPMGASYSGKSGSLMGALQRWPLVWKLSTAGLSPNRHTWERICWRTSTSRRTNYKRPMTVWRSPKSNSQKIFNHVIGYIITLFYDFDSKLSRTNQDQNH